MDFEDGAVEYLSESEFADLERALDEAARHARPTALSERLDDEAGSCAKVHDGCAKELPDVGDIEDLPREVALRTSEIAACVSSLCFFANTCN